MFLISSYHINTQQSRWAKSKKRPGFISCHVTVTSCVLKTTIILQILYDQNDQIERHWHSPNTKWFRLTLRKKVTHMFVDYVVRGILKILLMTWSRNMNESKVIFLCNHCGYPGVTTSITHQYWNCVKQILNIHAI